MTDRELSERVIATVAAYLHSDYCIGDRDGRVVRVEGEERDQRWRCPPASGLAVVEASGPCERDRDRDLCHAQDAASCCTMIRLRRTSSSFELDRGGTPCAALRVGCLDRPKICAPTVRRAGYSPLLSDVLIDAIQGIKERLYANVR